MNENPDRVRFLMRFALQRLRSQAGEVARWGAVNLPAETERELGALFAAARGDRSYSESELAVSALEFAKKHRESGPLFSKLSSGLRLLVATLEDERIDPDQRETARAALTYFAEVEDAIPDDLGPFGFLDDAIVVQRAIQEIYPERRELGAILDQVAETWPFVIDLAFGDEERPYPASEFLLANAALVVDGIGEAESPGAALIMTEPGPLPFAVAFVLALGEVRDKLDYESVLTFQPGERLISRQGGGEVEFVRYCQFSDEGMSWRDCPVGDATHFELLVPAKDGERARRWRRIEDIGSLKRSPRSEGGLRSGRVALGVDGMPVGPLERIFGLTNPAVVHAKRGRVLLVGPVGTTRDLAGTLAIFGTPLLEVLPMGQERLEGDRFESVRWTQKGPGGTPVLSVMRTTAEALELVETDGDNIVAVVASVTPETTDAMNLQQIADSGCRVLAILQERDSENRGFLATKGFRFWMWDETWLRNLDWPAVRQTGEVSPIRQFEDGNPSSSQGAGRR